MVTRRASRFSSNGAFPHELRDYALLADGERGILADPDGELAWMCFPSWSDPAVLASLLGSAGSYRIQPNERYVPGGYYEEGTLIWRQRWVTNHGVVECRQALAYPGRPDRAVILRRVAALDGEVALSAVLALAGDYGRQTNGPWHRDGPGDPWETEVDGIHARWMGAPHATPVQMADGPAVHLDFRLGNGETHDFVLELQQGPFETGHHPEPEDLWRQTTVSWAESVPQCREIPAGRDVRQSFATLRGLTDAHGATVAAVTTALPERAEAGRNYDYRYGWIRDICYIGHAGAAVEGRKAVLDDAVRWVCARILADGVATAPAYRGDGSPVPEPLSLGLLGYPGGSDIVGNRVRHQFQLDLFGEVLLLLANAASQDRLDADGWDAAEVAIRAIGERSEEKEHGIWEIGPDHWTHSRLICVAGLRAIAEHAPASRHVTRALSLADQLLSSADRSALHPSGRWQRSPGDARVDASLLLSEIRGAVAADDPRSVATRHAVIEDLCEDDYIYRYAEPGEALGKNEGAFLICNFWMALAYLGCGETTKGVQYFERTRASCSSSGLFSEEYDVAQRQLRGNLPQSFVHALLIETAAAIGRR
jgi:GH15 family glucan-1,4-alpha-glucosidase